ncbi:unnamed protein product [Gongylonema pulchrum]|uniref:Radical SAM protein n=1 Tax=Gongylonema pulchrum TaxID=637853 RepID=A0A183EXD6_9BILA|nr:unnamed protein product [Gongylonema pulchrum]
MKRFLVAAIPFRAMDPDNKNPSEMLYVRFSRPIPGRNTSWALRTDFIHQLTESIPSEVRLAEMFDTKWRKRIIGRTSVEAQAVKITEEGLNFSGYRLVVMN